MKKLALFAVALAASAGLFSANAQEVTYVEDCSQGVLLNRFRDNWFITGQGGATYLTSEHDSHADFKNKIGATAGLFVGKWASPVFGFRLGADWMLLRGACKENGYFREPGKAAIEDGYYPERLMTFGPQAELMLNLTNWWCGYKPNRVYNAVFHIGGGGVYTYGRKLENDKREWANAHNRTFFAVAGLQNNFRISKQMDFFIDLQYSVTDYTQKVNDESHSMAGQVALQAGFTYKFKRRDWSCPVTAVCPTWKYTDAEGDALVARLATADNKIKDLQSQLDACLNRPQGDCDCMDALATVYYPIGVSTLSSREVTLVQSMAKVMLKNPDKKYILTGWADNYTGNNRINTRLRNQRVDGVKNCLIKAGVPASQLETRIDDNNLTDYGKKGARFDRAVTVVEAK